MGGCTFDDDWELASDLSDVRTIVLVGKTGNGKSATGNSIIGGKAVFRSMLSFDGVTSTCDMKQTVLEGGQILNVIDTPGLFSAEVECMAKEILKCIKMAKNGIHAILLVISLTNRFSKEEEAVVESLFKLFGKKVKDYIIIVFTGGDALQETQCLDDFLGRNAPLKETLHMFGNRRTLFDNKTSNEIKKSKQLKQLLSLVDEVVHNNGGKPFTNEIFLKLKDEDLKFRDQFTEFNISDGHSQKDESEFHEKIKKSYEEQLSRFTEMIELKLKENTHMLELQVKEEQLARLKAEVVAKDAHIKSNDEIRKLTENLEKSQKDAEESTFEADKKLKKTAGRLKQQLKEEKAARLKLAVETEELRECLKNAQREAEELRKKK